MTGKTENKITPGIAEECEYLDEPMPVDYLLINFRLRLFGAILVLLRKTETNTIDTAGVSVKSGMGMLRYNGEFMRTLDFKDRVFVLMHEASHLIFSSHSRGVNKERTIWNFAADIIINELLHENFGIELPQDAMSINFLRKAKFLNERERISLGVHSADDIYNIMMSRIKKVVIKKGRAHIYTKGGGVVVCRVYGEMFDEDSIDSRLKEKIEGIEKECEDAGSAAGEFLKQIGKICGVYFPFEQVLKKHFEKKEYDFSRKNRRMKMKNSFFPRRKNPAFKVYAAVDVSGSVFEYTERFLSYITALPEFEEVDFFDTKIVRTIKKGELMPGDITGYGGTDVNPVFQKWRELEKKAGASKTNFVLLTDGYVLDVKERPKAEVLCFTCGIDMQGCKNIKIK